MNFKDTLEYMYSLLPMYQRIGKVAFKKDLTNTIRLCERLGNPQNSFKSVHIAGTNGKGSSAHMMASIMQEAGYNTGLYTSPHLQSFTERIRVNGREVDQKFVCDFIELMKQEIEEIRPSFFEITVAMAFSYFSQQRVDVAVIEVGLGGRLDSTNVITPVVALITSIGLDHTDMLGETLPEIAFEKAGIIKQNIPVVICETQAEVSHVFAKKAKEMKAPIYFADQEYQIMLNQNSSLDLRFDVKSNSDVYTMSTDLGGEYQLRNLPGVLKTRELLGNCGFHITDEHLRIGLKNVKKNTGLFGRWQILRIQPLTICDTVHNEAGVRYIIKQIGKINHERLHIILGVVEGKDLRGIFQHLPKDAFYYFCEPDVPRALKSDLLQKVALEYGCSGPVLKDVNAAIELATAKAGPKDLIFIGGSNFIVAEIKNLRSEKEAAKV